MWAGCVFFMFRVWLNGPFLLCVSLYGLDILVFFTSVFVNPALSWYTFKRRDVSMSMSGKVSWVGSFFLSWGLGLVSHVVFILLLLLCVSVSGRWAWR